MKKNKTMKIIIMIAVILIPVIYSFFYLKSYWDPYGNLQDLPVAIVNSDKGENGENQGEELVKSLIESDSVKIEKVTTEEAQEGLINGKYYAKLIIPEDFTESLRNAQNIDRQKTVITYSPNKKSNYLASQIINNVVLQTELSLKGKIAGEVVAELKSKLEEVPDKMEEINQGVTKIKNGTTTLNTGIDTLNTGTETLATNYEQFDQGINHAYLGSESLEKGIKEADNGSKSLVEGEEKLNQALALIQEGTNSMGAQTQEKLEQLVNAVNQIAQGNSNLENNLTNYITSVNTLNDTTKSILQGVIDLGVKHPELLADSEFQILNKTANQIQNSGNYDKLSYAGKQITIGTKELTKGSNSLKNSMSQLSQISQGIQNLQIATTQVKQGINKLQEGTNQLNQGTSQLKEGSTSLKNGLGTLKDSSNQVKNGLDVLKNGSGELAKGGKTLETGIVTMQNEITSGIDETEQELKKLEGLDTYIENPIEIKEESYGEVEQYGVSFTPLFLSIGLWVGALMAYVILYYDQEKRYQLLGKQAKNKWLQIGLYFVIAIIQGLLTGFLLKMGLGFSVQNIALYYGSCVLIALAFMSVIQFLIINFGDIGKFIALIVLVLQLAASGGTFPVETIHKGFQAFTNYLPMTYSIKLLKESLIISDAGFAGHAILILCGIIIVPLALTLIINKIKEKREKQGIQIK